MDFNFTDVAEKHKIAIPSSKKTAKNYSKDEDKQSAGNGRHPGIDNSNVNLGEIAKDGLINSDVADELKVESQILKRDEIGEPKRVIQLWQSGDQYGVTISGNFFNMEKEVYLLFTNAVKANQALNSEIEELERKLKVLRYAQ